MSGLILGHDLPAIFRPADEAGELRLLGDAYMQVIMDGEFATFACKVKTLGVV